MFRAFDELCDQRGIEKIKTVGDAYMVSADQHVHIWDGDSWEDAGALRGPLGYSTFKPDEQMPENHRQCQQ